MSPHHTTKMTRREALRTIGTGVALAGLTLTGRQALAALPEGPASGDAPGWDLPPLPYAYAALEPHLDARTMEIHHTKHHQAYLNNAKALLRDHPELLARGPAALVRDLASVPEALRPGIRNQVGGHVNHSFFWRILTPAGGTPSGRLAEALVATFGTVDGFRQQFADAAMKRFGSGWAWLSAKPDGQLSIHSTANQDSPLSEGLVPVLGLDVWEHAYYLHYQNLRGDYVKAFWQVVNWDQAGKNYLAALQT